MARKNKKSQVQYSVTKQLLELYKIANQNGLYDAADIIKRIIERTKFPEGIL